MYKDYKFQVALKYNAAKRPIFSVWVNKGDVHYFTSRIAVTAYLESAKKILDNRANMYKGIKTVKNLTI